MWTRPLPFVLSLLILFFAVLSVGACQNSTETIVTEAVPTTASFFAVEPEVEVETEIMTAVATPSTDSAAIITVDAAAQPIPIAPRVLGTNLPA